MSRKKFIKIGNAARMQRPKIGKIISGSQNTPKSGVPPLLSISPIPEPMDVKTKDAGKIPRNVEITKRRNGTSRKLGTRLAKKKGTPGIRRIRKSIDHWFLSMPSFIFFTKPCELSNDAASLEPKPQRAARKIVVAPNVAPKILKNTPGKVEKRKPPVIDRINPPGIENATNIV